MNQKKKAEIVHSRGMQKGKRQNLQGNLGKKVDQATWSPRVFSKLSKLSKSLSLQVSK